jgi:hypothetical protein
MQTTKAANNTARHYALLMSIAFCLVFMAFSAAQVSSIPLFPSPVFQWVDLACPGQNFATSRDKEIGTRSLGILYAAFTLTNAIASFVVLGLGAKFVYFYCLVVSLPHISFFSQIFSVLWLSNLWRVCGRQHFIRRPAHVHFQRSARHRRCHPVDGSGSLHHPVRLSRRLFAALSRQPLAFFLSPFLDVARSGSMPTTLLLALRQASSMVCSGPSSRSTR